MYVGRQRSPTPIEIQECSHNKIKYRKTHMTETPGLVVGSKESKWVCQEDT